MGPIAQGMYYALFGPTVQDLAVTLDVGLFRVLFLLAARGVGYFLGAMAGESIPRRRSVHLGAASTEKGRVADAARA